MHDDLLDDLPADLLARIRATATPIVVAIDGRSGSGKSTLAAALASTLDATIVAGDDFFAGGTTLREDSPAQRAEDCIDWRRQREVLVGLLSGREAVYRGFDWEAFDGRLSSAPTVCPPRPIVLLEGVYSGRPELADLVHLRVLLRVPDEVRAQRLLSREGSIGAWERQWHEAEAHYFREVAPPETFDVVLDR